MFGWGRAPLTGVRLDARLGGSRVVQLANPSRSPRRGAPTQGMVRKAHARYGTQGRATLRRPRHGRRGARLRKPTAT